jgi:hypothetical protein
MKVVSVAAPCNGSGKTSLLVSIASTFPQVFSAAKFTTIYREERFCPAKDHDCACRRLEGKYLVCTDPEVLKRPDTDTGKLSATAARNVYWCIARLEGYPEMLAELREHCFDGIMALLMEGNTIIQFLTPHLRLFMVNPWLPLSWWKEHSDEHLEKADFVVLNPFRDASSSADKWPPNVESVLRRVESKQILMENSPRLDLWQDRRLFQAISALIGFHN